MEQKTPEGLARAKKIQTDLFYVLTSRLILIHPLLYIIKSQANFINIILKVIIRRNSIVRAMVNVSSYIPLNCACRNFHRDRITRIKISEIFASHLFI